MSQVFDVVNVGKSCKRLRAGRCEAVVPTRQRIYERFEAMIASLQVPLDCVSRAFVSNEL